MQATLQEYQFHQRLCARDDPVAFAELAEWLYDTLVQDVRRRAGHQADPILVEEAVGQALLDYHDRPEGYDPGRISLRSYLVMAAYGDFRNAFAREHRVQAHQVSLSDLTLRKDDIAGSADTLDEQLHVDDLLAVIDEIFPDPVERRVVDRIINHVHAPEPYIHLLHLEGLPADEQVRQAKLAQYRIARRLRRNLTSWLTRTGEEA